MNARLEALAERLAEARVEAALARLAAADLPPGLSAVREGDAVAIGGIGLIRALAEDARLLGLVEAAR